jgi:excisionase family DNA binding protein
VEKYVKLRERRFAGYFVSETELAWLLRLPQGGDHWLPKRSTRILSRDSVSGQVTVAISPSIAAEIDRQPAPRNLLYFSTQQVAEMCHVSVETVRKWIRDGLLGADSIGNGSAAFEYRIPEAELHRIINFQRHRG